MLAVISKKLLSIFYGSEARVTHIQHESGETDTELGRHHRQTSLLPSVLRVESVDLFPTSLKVTALLDLLPECRHIPVLQRLAKVCLVTLLVHVEFPHFLDWFSKLSRDHRHERFVEKDALRSRRVS